jgi:transposase-like protein
MKPNSAVDSASSSTLLEASGSVARNSAASSEVAPKALRRSFALGYKRRIVAMAAGLPAGEIGAMLRREGLYSSHLTFWRRQLSALDARTPEPKRGRKVDPARPQKLQVERLERENARLAKRLAQAEAIIDAQKKLCALLGLPSIEEQP